MSFFNPLLLFAALGVALPILAHLLARQKVKKTDWAAMQFLNRNVRVRSRQIRLRDVLLLLLRCMALLLLVFALARPAWRDGVADWLPGEARSGVVIGIDASFSMNHGGEGATRFDRALDHVEVISQQIKPGDPLSLVLLGGEDRVLIRNMAFDRERFAELLQEAKAVPSGLDLDRMPDRLKELVDDMEAPKKEVYVITDVQERDWRGSSERFREALADLRSEAEVFLVPVSGAPANLTVTELELVSGVLRKGTTARYQATVKNCGTEPVSNIEVQCRVEDVQIDSKRIPSIAAGASETVSLFVPFHNAGATRITAEVSGDLLPTDNVRRVVAIVRDRVSVLCVDGSNGDAGRLIVAALLARGDGAQDEDYLVRSIPWLSLPAENLEEVDVIVFADVPEVTPEQAEQLSRHVQNGNGLVWFAGQNVKTEVWNERSASGSSPLLPAKLGQLADTRTALGAGRPLDPDMPDHSVCLPLRSLPEDLFSETRFLTRVEVEPSPSSFPILRLAGSGAPILLEHSLRRGHVFQFTTSADTLWNNMAQTPVFPMLMQQIVTYLAGREFEQSRMVGDSLSLSFVEQPDSNDAIFEAPSEHIITVPVREHRNQFVAMLEGAKEAGFYEAKVSVQAPGLPVAVNVDPGESDVASLSASGLEANLEGIDITVANTEAELAAAIETSRTGRSSWRFFMIAGLVLLLVECLFADRMRKRKQVRSRRTEAALASLILAGLLSPPGARAADQPEGAAPGGVAHQFTVPEGYVLKRVAAPPLVQRPIHMGFDNDGVLYVTDSSGNTDPAPTQLKDPQHRVLRLVDRDADGVYNESTVFADRLPFPEGILVHEGSVYVGAPPHIWRLTDTDGDHVADKRTEWFDGGSIEGCGNDMHGPYLGPDGYFYWCKGAFAPQTHVLGNGETFKSNAAHIYRAKPDGSELEVVITGGMNNPVGLAFSDSGERFLSGTFFDLSGPGKRDGILHAVYGGMFGKKNNRVLSLHPSTGDLLPIATQMGPAAPSGVVMAKSDRLGLRGDLLCADFNLRRISRHQLAKDGSSYRATTSSFLESDQSDFHPTDVIEDADGSLLVADTGSWYMICCPTSKVAKPHVLGAIYRLEKRESPAPKDPRGLELDWEQPQVSWLSDSRPAVVKRAIDALATEEHIAALRTAEARIPALWTLHRIPEPAARQAVRNFLRDEDPDVRLAALRSAGLWRDEGAMVAVRKLLTGDAHQSRLAAMALGRIGHTGAIEPLLAAGASAVDPFLRHAIVYALYEIAHAAKIPGDSPIAEQVRLMHEVKQRHAPPHVMPKIELADQVEPDPEELAKQQARLKELAALLPQGDAKRGEAIFNYTTKSLCLTCHVMGDQGVKFGPDLTGIGSIRTEQDLLEAIVYPSSSIARYYEMVTFKTNIGKVSGMIVEEAADKIIIAAAPRAEVPMPIKAIRAAKHSNVSLMPQVFDGQLKPDEIADLVAYLKESKLPGTTGAKRSQEIPPHRAVDLPGLHAYAQKSIAAGEEVEFRVSSRVPYELSVVRLGANPEVRDDDPVLKAFKVEKPQAQPIHPGSYVHVANGLPPERRLAELTIEGWIRPFSLAGWQGLITQHGYPERCGIGLFINDGKIAFMTGGGGAHDPGSLHFTKPGLIKAHAWQHIAGTWDGKVKRIFINGEPVAEFSFAGVVRPGPTALRLGAYGSEGVASSFYNGDLAMCALHGEALDTDQIKRRVAERGLTRPKGNSLLACWSFTEERGTKVADSGPDGRDGQIINRGTWMIGGPSFDAAAIGRHDKDYDPTKDPNRGHGLRLAADELYNARWDVNHRFQLPEDAKSGVYAGRFDFEIDGKPMRYHTTFIVRRPESRPKAPLLVLVSSNTWLAYNSAPFPVNHGPGLINMGTGGLRNSHPSAPVYSGYSDHHGGQPTYKIGMKLPWPAAGPNKTYIGDGYSHLLRGERFLHLWLDRHGYEYDVITDHDLDRHPEILEGYKAVLLNGHSEYWSAPAYDGLDNYLKAGGAAVVMSGNTMFWRVSFDESGEVMECRKFGKGIGGRARAKVGELYHSHDFKRGSLMRFCGLPAWKLVGLTCIGWGGGNFGHYKVDQPDHFLFNEPNKVDLKKGDAFGFANRSNGAVGHEYDVRLSTLLKATKDPKVKGLVEPEGITTLARSHEKRAVLDFNAESHQQRVGGEQTIAEIIYWERPQGGRVFHTGSIATAWGMFNDEHLSGLMKNVLDHFGVKEGAE